jgi:hypothetical protein
MAQLSRSVVAMWEFVICEQVPSPQIFIQQSADENDAILGAQITRSEISRAFLYHIDKVALYKNITTVTIYLLVLS